MFRALIAGVLIAQTVFVPMTGARNRQIETRSLFHTLFHDFFLEDDGTTYVQTGDIPAMWLRDSSAQTLPYIRFQRYYPILRNRFAGVIERDARGECRLWQKRFWEHVIRNDDDYRAHLDYVHINPVRHGHACIASNWPYSSIHRYIARGMLPPDWACDPGEGEFGE